MTYCLGAWSWGRVKLGAAMWGIAAGTSLAQLPTARLDGVSPRGGQAGHDCEVTLHGTDLEDVRTLAFSHPGITAAHVDGPRFKVTIAVGVPPGLHAVRASGRYGISTGTIFVVGRLPEFREPPGNHTPATAAAAPLPVTINGAADADASDFYKIMAVEGQTVHLDCAAQRIDSPLNAVVSVRDPRGIEVHRAQRTLDRDPLTGFVPAMDGEYLIEVHDATWRGGSNFIYRLTVSTDAAAAVLPAPVPLAGVFTPPPHPTAVAESEPNDTAAAAQPFAAPGEITGNFDRDWFSFSSAAAGPLMVEVVSHRLGAASDPVVVVYKVTRDAAGAEQVNQVAEFDDTPGPPGGERFRLGSRDPVGRLNAEAGATYRLFVTDRFDSGGRYRLVVREPQPDFQVLAMPESPASGGNAYLRWTPLLRRHGASALQVAVVRQDGFDDPVVIKAEGLPPGVDLPECWVPPGQSAGWLVLRAAGDAAAWSGRLVLNGHAGDTTRPVREVTPRWSVGDAGAERVDLRLAADGPMLAVTEDADVPMQVEPAGGPPVIETSLGATLQVPVKFVRAPSHKGFKGEWESALLGLPGQRAWQPAKPAADATEATLSLALTKKDGNQFVAGTWTMYAGTRGTVQWQPDEKVPVREVRDAAFSAPIQVKIEPSPVRLAATESLEVARGGKTAVAVTLERRFGFGEAVELRFLPPGGLNGLTAPAVTVAKEATEASLVLECGADIAPGRYAGTIEAVCRWNGEELVSRHDVTIEITP